MSVSYGFLKGSEHAQRCPLVWQRQLRRCEANAPSSNYGVREVPLSAAPLVKSFGLPLSLEVGESAAAGVVKTRETLAAGAKEAVWLNGRPRCWCFGSKATIGLRSVVYRYGGGGRDVPQAGEPLPVGSDIRVTLDGTELHDALVIRLRSRRQIMGSHKEGHLSDSSALGARERVETTTKFQEHQKGDVVASLRLRGLHHNKAPRTSKR